MSHLMYLLKIATELTVAVHYESDTYFDLSRVLTGKKRQDQ
jgi:hypothetical protein